MDSPERRRQLRRRAKALLKPLPRRSNLARYPLIKHVAHWAKPRPELWSYRAPHTTRALYLGSVLTWLPLAGIQMLLAFAVCVVFRANLPITAALQLISNPLTVAPMYVGTYQVGKAAMALVGIQPQGLIGGATLNLTIGGVLAGLAMAAVIDGGLRIAAWRRLSSNRLTVAAE